MKKNEAYDLYSYYDSKSFDYHVHIGQFNDKYFEPHKVIEKLVKNRLKGCWFSSTTSCMKWDNEKDKIYLLNHIEDEVNEALFTAMRLHFDAKALYWVNLFEYFELLNTYEPNKIDIRESIEKYMFTRLENCDYFGFKIHTKVNFWDIRDERVILIFDVLCDIASKYNMPILIHSGVDEEENPKRFEQWYKKYNFVKFIIAHLKPLNVIIDLMHKYRNLYVDSSFANKETKKIIFNAGIGDRVLYGTDYPINENCYKYY